MTSDHRSAGGTSSTPFQGALSIEVGRLEVLLARAGIVLAAGGLALAAYTAVFISRPLGSALLVFAVGLLAWFGFVAFIAGRGVLPRALPWVAALVEVSLPTPLVLIDVATQGAEYAVESAAPLQFYQVFVVLGLLRLRPLLPVLTGLVGALEYGAVVLLVAWPQLPPEAVTRTALRPDMMIMRCVVIAVSGLATALIARALRNAFGGAVGLARSKELFGKYRMERQLASGGMGVVWRATYCPEGGFRRAVALKRIHPHLAAQPALVDQFRSEAELCSRLLHPNIVQVLDFGRVDDTFFLAMEFVDGGTLLQVMARCQERQGGIPARLVAYIGREMCSALNFAHREAVDDDGHPLRVIHRDINPPNVLLTRSGLVKVSDYGVAKALRAELASHTTSGVGKAGYMAPEQARGAAVDERADLFATGVVLWECLCMRHLFQRENATASLHALLTVQPEPPSVHHGGPLVAGWDPFFARALAREPAERFQSALEMREALDQLLEAEGGAAPGELERFLASLPPSVAPPSADADTVPIR